MNKKLQLELIWWLVTGIVVVAVMLPIWQTMPNFPFFSTNIVYILAMLTFARYAFGLEYTFLSHAMKVKMVFLLFSLLILGLFIGPLNDFQRWWDEGDHDTIFQTIPFAKRDGLSSYIKSEFSFFAIGGFLACLWFTTRLFRSVWRQWNNEGV